MNQNQTFKVEWLEVKSPEWKVATLSDEKGTQYTDVSINAVSKKGEPFPNFENISLETPVIGVLWTSPSGKHYLFPPKANVGHSRASGGAFKTEQIKEAQASKARSIAEAQDRSAWMWAKTNAATILAGTERFKDPLLTNKQISDIVIDLATKIYNGEPTEPFN